MYFTLGKASEATGMSKATISRALKSGKISGVKGEDGSYSIDPAELHRVFPAVSRNSDVQQVMEQSAKPEMLGGTVVLHRELEVLREERSRERAQLERQIEDLRGERDRLLGVVEEQAKSMARLTHQGTPEPTPLPEPDHQPKGLRGWLHRLTR